MLTFTANHVKQCMILSRNTDKINISIGNEVLQVEKFKYLCSIVMEHFTCKAEVKTRKATGKGESNKKTIVRIIKLWFKKEINRFFFLEHYDLQIVKYTKDKLRHGVVDVTQDD